MPFVRRQWLKKFLSTLSLRRATPKKWPKSSTPGNFYPRSPCGERRALSFGRRHSKVFLSTLSLRRATILPGAVLPLQDFYPRSPCGERPFLCYTFCCEGVFLSTLSLRRATTVCGVKMPSGEFLSTLSLRRATSACRCCSKLHLISIHALLAESDAGRLPSPGQAGISIHALLAESDGMWATAMPCGMRFLSTLSLRRATSRTWRTCCTPQYFYPRSPCGERLPDALYQIDHKVISIHALLAESDAKQLGLGACQALSIHALLAESDPSGGTPGRDPGLSIHALLAESDPLRLPGRKNRYRFLSTLSLRRATPVRR